MGWAGIHAVEYDAVKVRICVHSGTESLDCGHRTAEASLDTMMNAGAAPLVPDRDDLRAIPNQTAELIPDIAVKTVLKSPSIGSERKT